MIESLSSDQRNPIVGKEAKKKQVRKKENDT